VCRRGRAAPANRVTVGRRSWRQQLILEGPNTPSAHLIPANVVDSVHRAVDLFHRFSNRKLIH
jgi:hypothetical protein